MGIIDYFRNEKPGSASVARDRLKLIVAHERKSRNQPDYLPQMQRELVEVIRKYVSVDVDQVQVDLQDGDVSVLELTVTLPE
ncbi:cell division topological specificity factor MinE [Biformimicrobium ophioploci]|uniref:Cell division topological specificity factor n=1 Tax=Biformimicrobium ophioploci TaxID=3036711 RepID=A0ABQ6LYU3_9GAMM|nr:cell division topological specificity factor MinE [Microbulbifer sp. NKW57]GMG87268.1 cell division topological specificity factor MinE [Microbulbifer sp. NKW57]